MYKYKKRNPFSTKASVVYDETNQDIAYIRKVYNNPIQRLISILTLSLRFRKYEVRNHEGNVIIKANAKSMLDSKHFALDYYHDNTQQKVLFDKKSSGSKDTYGIIKLNDRILNIYADENQNTYIKDAKLDIDIASWKQVGDYAEVRAGKDSFFQEYTLLCIAMLHIFADNHVRHQKAWSLLGPPTI